MKKIALNDITILAVYNCIIPKSYISQGTNISNNGAARELLHGILTVSINSGKSSCINYMETVLYLLKGAVHDFVGRRWRKQFLN